MDPRSHDVMKELQLTTPKRNTHALQLPPQAEMQQILHKHQLQGLQNYSTALSHKEEKPTVQQYLKDKQNEMLIYTHENQCKKAIKEQYAACCPLDKQTPGPMALTMKQYGCMHTKFENTYMPQCPTNHTYDLAKILSQSDDNPAWYQPRYCQHCQFHGGYTILHQLFECSRCNRYRKSIYNPILTEPDFHRNNIKYQ